MPPVSDSTQLTALHRELEQSLQANDWTDVAAVDLRIRQCLEDLAGRSELDEPTRVARARLKALHDSGRQACADECERLRMLLINHLEYAEGRAAYQRVDLYGLGDPR